MEWSKEIGRGRNERGLKLRRAGGLSSQKGGGCTRGLEYNLASHFKEEKVGERCWGECGEKNRKAKKLWLGGAKEP